MKKFKTTLIITLCLTIVLSIGVTVVAAGLERTAYPSSNKFMMDGKKIVFDSAYNIDDSNYIQLRSVAIALKGTDSQFNVYWDSDLKVAVIETGKPYTGSKPEKIDTKDLYSIGETFATDNCEVAVTGYSLEQDIYGDYWANVMFEVYTASTSDKCSKANRFIDKAIDENGKEYTGFSYHGNFNVTAGERKTYIAIYAMDGDIDMASIIIKDPISGVTASFKLY